MRSKMKAKYGASDTLVIDLDKEIAEARAMLLVFKTRQVSIAANRIRDRDIICSTNLFGSKRFTGCERGPDGFRLVVR